MSESKTPARPPQVTMAAAVAIVGGALLVIGLFDAMEQLRSAEMRASIDDFLSTSPGDGLGLSEAGVVSLLRGLVLFNGALAAASVVLGVFVLQRHNPARIVFTVAAALMLLTAPVSGGVLPILLAFGAVTLWMRPARDWFAGREPAEKETTTPQAFAHPQNQPHDQPRDQPQDQVPPPPARLLPPHESDSAAGPAPATYPFGERPGGGVQAPVQQVVQPPAPYGYPARPVQPERVKRPPTVLVACLLTWGFTGVVVAAFLFSVVALVAVPQDLLQELRKNPDIQSLGLAERDLLALLWVLLAVVLLWGVVALFLGVLTFRGIGWARIALTVSAGVTALLSLTAAPLGIPLALVALAAIVLLYTGGANAWFKDRSASDAGASSQAPPRPPAPKPPSNVW